MTQKPSGPQPNPSAAGRAFAGSQPTVVVVPPVEALVGDAKALLKKGVDQLKRKTELSPTDVRTLEGLLRSLRMVQDAEDVIKADLRARLPHMTEEELRAYYDNPELLLGGGKP